MSNPAQASNGRFGETFLIFLGLGLTSFGGPIAHLGYFRDEFVTRRKWLSERAYADLVALCQFLPGPASSQVGMALGLSRAGYRGALAAWLGFTMPSAIALVLFAYGVSTMGDSLDKGVLQGLKVAAVAVVAQAVYGMAANLCTDNIRIGIMVAASTLVLMLPSAWTQVMAITLAGLAGTLIYRPSPQENHDPLPIQLNPRLSIVWLILFAALLLGLPLMAGTMGNPVMAMVDQFYRAGSLVFGGGHVVLPLLQAETVNPAGVSKDAFLAGYGAAQAVPGPLFTFAAFLGASMSGGPAGWQGATIALLAIFLPSFLLVAGALPFWERIRQAPRAQAALMGINAAVVGLLLAALYDPVWSEGVRGPVDFSMVLVASIALVFWRVPPWLVVILCAAGGWLTGR